VVPGRESGYLQPTLSEPSSEPLEISESGAAAVPPRRAVLPAGTYFAGVALLYTWFGSMAQVWHLPIGLWWSQIFLFCIPTLLWLGSTGYRPLRFLRLTQFPPAGSRAMYLATSATVFVCASALMAWCQYLAPEGFAERFDEGRLLDSVTGGWRVVLFAAVVVGAPIAEEVVFRGYVLPALAGRIGIARAVIGQALLFSLIHLDPIGFVPRFVLGLVFGWLVILSGSLWSSIFAHALNNGLSTLIFFSLGQQGQAVEAVPWQGAVSAALLAAASGWLLRALLRRLRRTATPPPLPQDDPSTLRESPPLGRWAWALWAATTGASFYGVKLFADHFGKIGPG
jgi:membrane protease YdiL (CAAX protease family)